MIDFQEKYNLTTEKIECGHCKTKSLMRIICEEKDSVANLPYLVGNDDVYEEVYHTEYDYYRWEVLKCLCCSKVNILQYSSLADEWEYTGNNDDIAPTTKIDFLYPPPDPHKDKPLELRIMTDVMERLITDAEESIQKNEPVNAIDRIHTFLDVYLCAVCENANISYTNEKGEKKNATELFTLLRNNHPRFKDFVDRSQHLNEFFKAFSNIINRLGSIRNSSSLAHPSKVLLQKDEAILYISLVRLLIAYLDKKIMS